MPSTDSRMYALEKSNWPVADAAFGLQEYFLAYGGVHVDGLGEYFLASSAAVDVRVVKEMSPPQPKRFWTKRSASGLPSLLMRMQPTAMTGTCRPDFPS